MRRRLSASVLVVALGVGLTTVTAAQTPTVGVLMIATTEAGHPYWTRLLGGGLRTLGHDVGRSVNVEYRWAHGDISRYPKLAQELVALRPAVIVSICGPGLRAIRDASPTMPVIAMCADEVNFLGEVASLARPGGYTTGVTFLAPEAFGKRLEILRELLPRLSRLAVVHQPSDPIPAHWRELERLQPQLGLTLLPIAVERADDLDAAFRTIVRERAHAVFVFPQTRLVAERARIAELGRRHRVPTVADLPIYTEAGLLLSYGPSFEEVIGTTIAGYVDKILKGARPGDLPVVQPARLELVLNLATARAIGLTFPRSVLHRADRTIE